MHNYEKVNYRQKGKRNDGKISKGFIQSAHQKLSAGSIPSKFETIIYKNQNFKAFGSSSGRFFNSENENPAPGQYTQNQDQTFTTMDTSVSLSKKGYGNGFASITQRNTFKNKYCNSGPGPGFYEPQMKSQLLETRSTNLKGSSSFLKRTDNEEKHSLQTVKLANPGPAEYKQNPNYGKSITSYNSAFISQSKRAQYLGIRKGPGAGDYNISRSLIPKKSQSALGVTSSFAKAVDIDSNTNDMKQLTKFLEENKKIQIQGKIIQDQQQNIPGPGHYRNEKFPEFQSEHFRSQSSSNFKDGLKTRFGDFNDKEKEETRPRIPGPGTYKVEEIVGLDVHLKQKAQVDGPFFMSETKRQPYGKLNKLGPNTNIPFLPSQKKSFNLNLAKNWI